MKGSTNAQKKSLPKTSISGKVLKSTSNENLVEWGSLTASDVSALPDSTKYGKSLAFSSNTVTLNDQDGNSLSSINSVETTSNKTLSLSAQSTDTEYPSAKCVYDIIGDVDTLLTNLNSGGGVQPTPGPLPIEYFEFTSGEITGFSSTGQTAYNNGEITDLVLPSEDNNGNPVTSIGSSAFISCASLTSITIPNSVTSLNWYTFEYCTGLTSITIPSSVMSIGKSSFYGCTNLTSITVEPTVPPMLGSSVFDDTNDAPIYVPAQSVTDYQEATDWADYAIRIQAIQE